MRIDKGKLGEIGSGIVVFCVLLTTILVIRREFVEGSSATATTARASAPKRQAVYLDGWQRALTVGTRSGSADAPVQVIEFADFECPYCARYEGTVRGIRDKYPDQVAFTLVHYPLPQHDFAESAARAAECAHAQGHFEAMRSLLFVKQQSFGSVPWADLAEQVGIPDVKQFNACVNDMRPVEEIHRGKELAQEMGIRSTPTVIVNGWKFPVPPSSEDFDKIVENVVSGELPTEDVAFLAAAGKY